MKTFGEVGNAIVAMHMGPRRQTRQVRIIWIEHSAICFGRNQVSLLRVLSHRCSHVTGKS